MSHLLQFQRGQDIRTGLTPCGVRWQGIPRPQLVNS
nr:MAG TPA: hypothetical protein [Caudoviricetes sp.]